MRHPVERVFLMFESVTCESMSKVLESVTGERRGDFRDRTRSVQTATSVAKKFYDGSEGFTLTSQLKKRV